MSLRLGILGGGQLGQMLAQAGQRTGITCRCYDPDPEACARLVCEVTTAPFEDDAAITRFAQQCDVLTYEFENVPVSAVRAAERACPVAPGPRCLEVAQDRGSEKAFFTQSGLEVPPYRLIDSLETLRAAAADIGLPCILKTRRGGYDGKGQAVVRAVGDVGPAWDAIGRKPAILERMVPFTRELSVIAVRSAAGAFDHYPLVENTHERGILRVSRAPAPGVPQRVEDEAVAHVRTLMDAMQYVGVLAVELFEVEGRLLANEMAPRVHNSGHWTIEGAATSQFENHLRAVAGMPLGPCNAVGPSVMINFIGAVPDETAIRAIPHAHPHLYGKSGRANRKVGHATLVAPRAGAGGGQPPHDPFAHLADAAHRLRTLAAACDIP
ncbi:MAG TPA: 5-(carboxyamino)imidazole ribonucleotide synthase [Phycisphaerales bacterium]|nr:5-(carboxyamino)imidazole ribonucleotide synthase [Phycisphaerales bacterium]